MKIFTRIFAVALLAVLSGCCLFRDDRPAPEGSPYAVSAPPKASEKVYSEAEAVNAAATAISFRMSFSSLAPFRVIPVEGKLSPAGSKVHVSLVQMGLSRPGAPYPLLLEDRLDGNRWTVTLLQGWPDGEDVSLPVQKEMEKNRERIRKTFFSKTYLLKRNGEKQP
ncbi:MAG: hypothetical protein IJS14_15265 [Lentisphaeria bacterium]|nr:hypothetical protein [Lentisphaeria bacterium]